MTMNQEYIDNLWDRAVLTIYAAKRTLSFSSDTAANRAYYAAFYAVSALLASEEKFYKKHTALRAAVHKDLVHTGRWSSGLGDDYDKLHKLRSVADYGVVQHASIEDARAAIEQSERIIQAVHEARPDIFSLDINVEENNTD